MSDHADIFAIIRERLFTAAIGDVLDAAGFTRQFLPPEIRALTPDTVLVGRAMPVLEADCAGEMVGHNGQREPFGLMLRALDELKPNEVYIATGASLRYALWGGLMSARAKTLGAAGAVLDGFHRDTKEIRRPRLSRFLPRQLCAGSTPARPRDRLPLPRRVFQRRRGPSR